MADPIDKRAFGFMTGANDSVSFFDEDLTESDRIKAFRIEEEAKPDATYFGDEMSVDISDIFLNLETVPSPETLQSINNMYENILAKGDTLSAGAMLGLTELFDVYPYIKEYTIEEAARSGSPMWDRENPGRASFVTQKDIDPNTLSLLHDSPIPLTGYDKFTGPWTDTLRVMEGDLSGFLAEYSHALQYSGKTKEERAAMDIRDTREKVLFDWGESFHGKDLAYGKWSMDPDSYNPYYPDLNLYNEWASDPGPSSSLSNLDVKDWPFMLEYEGGTSVPEGLTVPVEFEAHQIIEPVLEKSSEFSVQQDFLRKNPQHKDNRNILGLLFISQELERLERKKAILNARKELEE